MITCGECAKLGSGYWESKSEKLQEKINKPKADRSSISSRKPTKPALMGQPDTSVIEDVEIVEGFGNLIKRAREKLGLTPEELAKKIGEKESVIKKIESEKFIPDIRLAAKIEHALKIRLLVRSPSLETGLEKPVENVRSGRGITLGEIVHLKTDRDEEEA